MIGSHTEYLKMNIGDGNRSETAWGLEAEGSIMVGRRGAWAATLEWSMWSDSCFICGKAKMCTAGLRVHISAPHEMAIGCAAITPYGSRHHQWGKEVTRQPRGQKNWDMQNRYDFLGDRTRLPLPHR